MVTHLNPNIYHLILMKTAFWYFDVYFTKLFFRKKKFGSETMPLLLKLIRKQVIICFSKCKDLANCTFF